MTQHVIQVSESKQFIVEPRILDDGKKFIDVRTYMKFGDGEEFNPTKKGVFIPTEHAMAVAEAILKSLKEQ